MRTFFILTVLLLNEAGYGQVFIQPGAGMYLQENSSLYIRGDFSAQDNINGSGRIYLNGDSIQWINLSGYTMAQLEIDNVFGVKLAAPLSISQVLNLRKGRLSLNGNLLELANNATIANEGIAAIESDKGGIVRKKINHHLTQYIIPLVSGQNYSRLMLSTQGKYADGSVSVTSIADASPHKPAGVEEWLNNYWKVGRSGISGDVNVAIDYSKIQTTAGSNSALSPYYWTSKEWLELHHSPNDRGSYINAKITGSGGEIFAMNFKKFSLYPNPASGLTRLTVSSPSAGKAVISILDLKGRIIAVQSASLYQGLNQVTIDVSRLAPGTYTLRCVYEGKKDTIKLIHI